MLIRTNNMSEIQEAKQIVKWGEIKTVCPCGGYYDKTTPFCSQE